MNGSSHVHHHPEGIVYSDADLAGEIAARLRQVTDLDCASVSIEVQACKVILTGSVRDTRARHVIEDLVVACPGVQDIENRIDVKSP